MIPALEDAKDDIALRGVALTVYLHLLYELDPVVFKAVKRSALAVELQLSEASIKKSLRLLVVRGYLERGKEKAGAGEPHRYRLVYRRMPVVPLERDE